MVFNLSETNSGGGGGGTTVTITCDDPDALYYVGAVDEDGFGYIEERPFPADFEVGSLVLVSTTLENVNVHDENYEIWAEVILLGSRNYMFGVPNADCAITEE